MPPLPEMLDRRHWMLGTSAALLGGCADAPVKATRGPVLWPAPPELPRYIHEATLRNADSLRDERNPDLMRQLVFGAQAPTSFGKPFAVAARQGRIYVTDTEARRVFVFDVPRRRVFAFGMRLEGELRKPAGVAVDDAGQVYVVDSTARRVVVYDELGLYQRHIDGGRDWVRPTALAVTPRGDRVFVVDTGGVGSEQHKVWAYDGEGRALGQIGRRGSAAGEFNLPADIAVGRDGKLLWVLDAGNFRVQAFDGEGRFVREFGSPGNQVGQFARPRGLAVDAQGLVYVSDAGFANVQVFDGEGQMLLAIGSRGDRDAPGRYVLPAKLAVDETSRLYVVDQFLHKVEVVRRLSDAEGQRRLREAG